MAARACGATSPRQRRRSASRRAGGARTLARRRAPGAPCGLRGASSSSTSAYNSPSRGTPCGGPMAGRGASHSAPPAAPKQDSCSAESRGTTDVLCGTRSTLMPWKHNPVGAKQHLSDGTLALACFTLSEHARRAAHRGSRHRHSGHRSSATRVRCTSLRVFASSTACSFGAAVLLVLWPDVAHARLSAHQYPQAAGAAL